MPCDAMPCRTISALCIAGFLHLTSDTKELVFYSTLACQLNLTAVIQPGLRSFGLPRVLNSNVASTWYHDSREHRAFRCKRELGKKRTQWKTIPGTCLVNPDYHQIAHTGDAPFVGDAILPRQTVGENNGSRVI